MTTSYQDKFDKEVFLKLNEYAQESANKGLFLQAAFIAHPLVEVSLRGIIRCLAFLRKIENQSTRKYWDEKEIRFSDLIKYYELLGGSSQTTEKLREYNKKRNELVHSMVTAEDMNDLLGKAVENYSEGAFLYLGLTSEIKATNVQFIE